MGLKSILPLPQANKMAKEKQIIEMGKNSSKIHRNKEGHNLPALTL